MSDPQPDRLKPRPPRAEPLQPDKPGSGTGIDANSSEDTSTDQAREAALKRAEQEQASVDNNREGFSR